VSLYLREDCTGSGDLEVLRIEEGIWRPNIGDGVAFACADESESSEKAKSREVRGRLTIGTRYFDVTSEDWQCCCVYVIWGID